jgi:hypothetical protein
MVARDGIEPPTPAFSGLRAFLQGLRPRAPLAQIGARSALTPERSLTHRKAVDDGGQGRNRTADASLFRAALYQLSYLARLADCTRMASVGLKEDVLRVKSIITIEAYSLKRSRNPGSGTV